MIKEIKEFREVSRETNRLLKEKGVIKSTDRATIFISACRAALQFVNIVLKSDELPSPHRDDERRQRMHPIKQAYLRAQGALLIGNLGKLAQEKRLRVYSEDHDFIDTHYESDFEPSPFEQNGSYHNYASPGPSVEDN